MNTTPIKSVDNSSSFLGIRSPAVRIPIPGVTSNSNPIFGSPYRVPASTLRRPILQALALQNETSPTASPINSLEIPIVLRSPAIRILVNENLMSTKKTNVASRVLQPDWASNQSLTPVKKPGGIFGGASAIRIPITTQSSPYDYKSEKLETFDAKDVLVDDSKTSQNDIDKDQNFESYFTVNSKSQSVKTTPIRTGNLQSAKKKRGLEISAEISSDSLCIEQQIDNKINTRERSIKTKILHQNFSQKSITEKKHISRKQNGDKTSIDSLKVKSVSQKSDGTTVNIANPHKRIKKQVGESETASIDSDISEKSVRSIKSVSTLASKSTASSRLKSRSETLKSENNKMLRPRVKTDSGIRVITSERLKSKSRTSIECKSESPNKKAIIKRRKENIAVSKKPIKKVFK
ncbi:hypothetical protein HK096_004317 [Nowakowskiella sp. JEL0078]|nr:hypothetical protein HK096_004317 [Nowakowskiella sp. JEL0078]